MTGYVQGELGGVGIAVEAVEAVCTGFVVGSHGKVALAERGEGFSLVVALAAVDVAADCAAAATAAEGEAVAGAAVA